MLSNRHDGSTVDPPRFTPPPEDVGTALADLSAAWELASSASTARGGLDVFVERYMPLRDELAWRAATGVRLGISERALLHAFDAVLDELDAGPEPLSPDVREIMNDVLRKR